MDKFFTKLSLLFTIAIIGLTLSVSATAHDFEIDGVYYDIVGDGCVEVVRGTTYYRGGGIEYHHTTGDVVIPARVNGYKVIGIGEFAQIAPSSISLPETLSYIKKYAFGGGTIFELYIPKSITNINECAFSSLSNLCKIEVDENNPAYDSRDNCNAIIRSVDNSLILGCANTIIPNTVTRIGDNAFGGNSSIIKISIPNSVTQIGKDAFNKCSSLLDIDISNSLISIGDYAFSHCSKLKKIVFPQNLSSIGNAVFSNCSNLEEVEFPSNLTSIGTRAFNNCSSLTSLVFPSSLQHINEYAFNYCSNLREVTFKSNLTIWQWAFNGCTNLEKVAFDYGIIGGNTEIFKYAFNMCSEIQQLILPKKVTSISEFAFYTCSNLNYIEVEKGNPIYESGDGNNTLLKINTQNIVPYVSLVLATKNAEIPKNVSVLAPYSFLDDRSSVVIPENVVTIENNAFIECDKLTDVYMKSNTPPSMTQTVSNVGAFSSGRLSNMTLHVPVGSLDTYSNPVLDWCLFGNIVEWEPSGIDDIEIDECVNDPVVYYNMQGVKVDNPQNGIFIKKQGAKTTKVLM